MLDEYFDVDVKIKIDSIFINSTNAYLQVSLTEAIVSPMPRIEDGKVKIFVDKVESEED